MKLYLEKDEAVMTLLKKYKKIDAPHPWFSFLKKEETMTDVYSEEGNFHIKKTEKKEKPEKIYKIFQSSFPSIERKEVFVAGYNLLIDKTKVCHELVHYLPFEHIVLPLRIFTFSLFDIKIKRVQCVLVFYSKREKEEELIDFYFECPDTLDEEYMREDISVFLSLLR
jgi:hypothetical protein